MLDSLTTSLWAAERAALDAAGYAAPLALADPARVDALVRRGAPAERDRVNPHARDPLVAELLRDSALTSAVERFCGKGLNLWRSRYFIKGPGAPEIAWHHDKHFFSGDADSIRLEEIGTHMSVLIALTEISVRTGVLEVLPGTHRPLPGLQRDERPFHKRELAEHFLSELPEALTAQRRAVPIPAGCFVIFHSALLHRSLPHDGEEERIGLAIRLIPRGIEVPAALATPRDVTAFPPVAV